MLNRQRALKAAAEREKIAYHGPDALRLGAEFFPIVWETSGAPGKWVIKFAQRVAAIAGAGRAAPHTEPDIFQHHDKHV